MERRVNYLLNKKIQFGDQELIEFTRKYERIRDGIDPVEKKVDWIHYDDDDEFNIERILIECPFCFNFHRIIIYTGEKEDVFAMDSNYCDYCQQEFIINPENEFQILVKTDENEKNYMIETNCRGAKYWNPIAKINKHKLFTKFYVPAFDSDASRFNYLGALFYYCYVSYKHKYLRPLRIRKVPFKWFEKGKSNIVKEVKSITVLILCKQCETPELCLTKKVCKISFTKLTTAIAEIIRKR